MSSGGATLALLMNGLMGLAASAQTVPVASPASSPTGNGTIRGVVVSAADSSPVVSAEIRSTAGRTLARSNQVGSFVLPLQAGSADTLVIRALGFREQRAAVNSNLRVVLESSPTVLPTFTTTIGQREIRAGEQTVRTTVLARVDIDAAAAISANQLLRQMPGLQEIPSPPAQTSIAIRGLDASRVLVLVDGEPVSGALTENRDIGRLSTVAAERIEVTKGPSSVEFGSDALGGVINLVTAAPSRQFSSALMLRQGELGRRESTAGVSQTLGAFGYRVSGGWRQVDRVTGVNADGSTLERVYDVRTSMRYKLTERLSMRADVQGAQERQRWPVGGGYNGFIDNRSGQGFVEAELYAAGGTFRARAFAQRYRYKFRQSPLLVPIAGSGDSLEQRERLERYQLAFSRPAGSHTIDVGTLLSSRDLISPSKVEGDSASDRVFELFARDAWKLGSVLATGGMRFTNSSLWGNSVNPSFGLAWQTNATLRVRSNVARGFRAPGFKEIRYTFSNPSGGYAVIGNPNLEPETSWSTSIGGTWAPFAHWSLDVEGYRNNVSNLIDTRYQGVNTAGFLVYQNLNVARAHTRGVEGSVQYESGPLSLTLGYDYLRARDDETALPLNRRATHTARAHVSRSWHVLSGFTSDISARYTGAAPLIGTVNEKAAVVGSQAEFLSVDGQLRLRITRGAEVSGGVNNLLDRRPVLYTPAYQRQLYVAMQLRFGRAE